MKSDQKTYSEVQKRLDELAKQAKQKDVSLKTALDLFDEALALGNQAVELVDTTDFSFEEEVALQQKEDRPEGNEEKERDAEKPSD